MPVFGVCLVAGCPGSMALESPELMAELYSWEGSSTISEGVVEREALAKEPVTAGSDY